MVNQIYTTVSQECFSNKHCIISCFAIFLALRIISRFQYKLIIFVKMSATNQNRKFNSDYLNVVLQELFKSNLSLSDIEKAMELFEKFTDIIVRINILLSLPSTAVNVTENSNEFLLQNIMERLRVTSIILLNCRIHTHNKNVQRRVNKRPSDISVDTCAVKKRKRGNRNLSLAFEDGKVASGLRSDLSFLEKCYICKKRFATNILKHELYTWMCFKCGEENLKKRNQMADLKGKVALVTGGRIKIGFETVLKLLRCGATVIVTTRFSNDAHKRYALQDDFSVWSSRLQIYKLDLRFISHVERFCDEIMKQFSHVDIFIQNAAQTIRRPCIFYKSLVDGERTGSFDSNATSTDLEGQYDLRMLSTPKLDVSDKTSQLLVHPEDCKYENDLQLCEKHFPVGATDEYGDQLDLRPKNTWITSLDEVETSEMIEVTLTNYMSPFILLKKLTPLITQRR